MPLRGGVGTERGRCEHVKSIEKCWNDNDQCHSLAGNAEKKTIYIYTYIGVLCFVLFFFLFANHAMA